MLDLFALKLRNAVTYKLWKPSISNITYPKYAQCLILSVPIIRHPPQLFNIFEFVHNEHKRTTLLVNSCCLVLEIARGNYAFFVSYNVNNCQIITHGRGKKSFYIFGFCWDIFILLQINFVNLLLSILNIYTLNVRSLSFYFVLHDLQTLHDSLSALKKSSCLYKVFICSCFRAFIAVALWRGFSKTWPKSFKRSLSFFFFFLTFWVCVYSLGFTFVLRHFCYSYTQCLHTDWLH